MSTNIPSTEDVRAALGRLTLRQIERLAALSGVNESTLRKLRYGEIADPSLEKVRKFWPHLDAVSSAQPNA